MRRRLFVILLVMLVLVATVLLGGCKPPRCYVREFRDGTRIHECR